MSKYHILLVDDEELALLGIENGIHWDTLGIETISKADSMKRAQQFLQSQKVDLMISDIEMPGGSGLELIRWVRDNYPDIQCIFYTCHAEFSYCQEAIRMGAADYVLKPIPYGELEAIIDRTLKQVKANREVKGLQDMWSDLSEQQSENKPSLVETVKQMIKDNLAIEMSREELAQKVFVNPDYLSRLFKKETGMSLSEYMIQKRLMLAQQLLEATDLSIVEISGRTGFSYSSYFVRIFKKKIGITPQQYREQHKK